MINYKKVRRVEEELYSVTCDVCGEIYYKDADVFEFQEFHHIVLTGGYGSVFGDENTVRCDICQHCLKEMIGEFCRCE